MGTHIDGKRSGARGFNFSDTPDEVTEGRLMRHRVHWLPSAVVQLRTGMWTAGRKTHVATFGF